MVNYRSCSVLNCKDKISHRHRFPNPKKDPERFQKWVLLCGNKILCNKTPDRIYNSNRVCHRHFKTEDHATNMYLQKHALPHLFLPVPLQSIPEAFTNLEIHANEDKDIDQIDETNLPLKATEKNNQIINQDDPADTSKPFNDTMKDASDILKLYNDISDLVNTNSEETERNESCNNDDFDLHEFIKPRSKPDLPTYKESNNDDEMNEATVDLTQIKNVQLEKPYFKGLKSFSLVSNSVHDVCRICLRLLKSEQIKKLDDQISVEGVDHLKDLLEIILPSLDLEIYSETVVCTKCTELLISSYELRKIWMLTEENFLKLVENKKEITRPDSDLIVITESKEGEVIDEYSKEDIKININFDHDYEETLEVPQSRRQEHNRDLVQKVLQGLPDLPDKSSNASKIEQRFNKNVDIFHNGIKLKTSIAAPLNIPRRKEVLWGSGPYICEMCAFSSSYLPQFQEHLRKHERSQVYLAKRKKMVQTFKCDICNKIFVTAHGLELHFSKHRSYKCNICDKEFSNNYSLKQHIRCVHLKEYTHQQCHICGIQFNYKSSLYIHLLKHNIPNKTYKCDHCPKKFKLSFELKNHFKKVHENENLVSCHYCGKSLKFEDSLRKHIRLYHLNEGEGICEICSKPYWKKPHLIRHKMRDHGIYPQQESKS